MRFACKYTNWTVHDWKRVILNDETKINIFNSDGRSSSWITNGEHVQPQCVQQTLKHGGGHIMIWGCMTTFGLGAWHRIEGIMDQHMYKFIWKTSCNLQSCITIWFQSMLCFNRIMIQNR